MVIGKWKVTRSDYALRTPWFSVRSDDCVTADGVEVAPYYAFEFLDFVHVLATTDDCVVLVRQYRHAYGAWSLELPGGVMDRQGGGGADAVANAARELQEETGYTFGSWRYVMALSIDPARYTNRLHFVRATHVVAGPASPEPTENIETILVTPAEAMELAVSGKIINAAHAAMLMIGLSDAAGCQIT